ncbi:MAG: hypothetical protein HOO96_23725, partial [Polyangiaceae bacterium]|nr:hypothetical protein [Polyangiaceae bacterium]
MKNPLPTLPIVAALVLGVSVTAGCAADPSSGVDVEWKGDALTGSARGADGTTIAAIAYRRGATEASLTLPRSRVTSTMPLAASTDSTVTIAVPVRPELAEDAVRSFLAGFDAEDSRTGTTRAPLTSVKLPGNVTSDRLVCFNWNGFWTCVPDRSGCVYWE